MKNTRVLPLLVVILSMMLSACSGLTQLSLPAPAAATVTEQTTAQSGAQAISVSAPITSAPAAVSPQAVIDAAALQNTYVNIFQSVNPSVVSIQVSSQVTSNSRSRSSGGQGQIVPSGEGSGFIWDSSGHIVTNNHVVEGAAKINVTFSDGSAFDAKLIGTDPNNDLAVIQVTGAPAALIKPIKVADSTQVKVGQLVVALGNPFGLGNTMTTGIVSAIGRSIQAGAGSQSSNTPNFSIPDIIQTDAAINPGNSGGALVDLNGALIGVPTQIESASGSNSGVGFAIPSAIVSRVAPQLIGKGAAEHSYLGITGGTITANTISTLNLKAGQQGILVASVVAGGPAETAGLQGTPLDANGSPTAAGDIITGIDGKSLTRFEDLVSYLSGSTQPGQTVTLKVLRGSQEIQVKVVLGAQPTQK